MAITEVQPPHTDDAAWSLYRDQVEDGDTHREFYDWLEGFPEDDEDGDDSYLGDCRYCDSGVYEDDTHYYDANDSLFCTESCMNWGGQINCGNCGDAISYDEARHEVRHMFVCGTCERDLTAASGSAQP